MEICMRSGRTWRFVTIKCDVICAYLGDDIITIQGNLQKIQHKLRKREE